MSEANDQFVQMVNAERAKGLSYDDAWNRVKRSPAGVTLWGQMANGAPLRNKNAAGPHSGHSLEQIVSHVIKHGAKIQEGGLGTILATREGLAKADAFSDQQKEIALAEAEKELAGLEQRTVGGEVRYYKTPTIYTSAVKKGSVRRWFETRKDGYDYSIKESDYAAKGIK